MKKETQPLFEYRSFEFLEEFDVVARQTIWMVDDSAYDTPEWCDHLLAAGVLPVVTYSA